MADMTKAKLVPRETAEPDAVGVKLTKATVKPAGTKIRFIGPGAWPFPPHPTEADIEATRVFELARRDFMRGRSKIEPPNEVADVVMVSWKARDGEPPDEPGKTAVTRKVYADQLDRYLELEGLER